MKKIFIFILVSVLSMFSVNAAKNDNVAKAIESAGEITSTIHDDAKTATGVVYNDAKDMVSTMYSDGKDLAKIIYPEVKAAVQSIAQAIGVAAEHVYTVLVKQYIVYAANEASKLLFALALVITGIVILTRQIKRSPTFDWLTFIPLTCILFGGIVMYNVDYEMMFMGFINPEYGAISQILEVTKSLVK